MPATPATSALSKQQAHHFCIMKWNKKNFNLHLSGCSKPTLLTKNYLTHFTKLLLIPFIADNPRYAAYQYSYI